MTAVKSLCAKHAAYVFCCCGFATCFGATTVNETTVNRTVDLTEQVLMIESSFCYFE